MNQTIESIFKQYCIVGDIVMTCDKKWEYSPVCTLTYEYMFGSILVAIGCGLLAVISTTWAIACYSRGSHRFIL